MRVPFIRSLFLAVAFLFLSIAGFAQVNFSIRIAPPELVVEEQSLCPGDGYIWTPGYWAWSDDDYFWVPGAWVMPPEIGFLWTPGYWGWGGGEYLFNEGYWGVDVGFYGGIDYGYGYFGNGYEGGRWMNRRFYYNTTLNRVNFSLIHNVYNTRVNEPINRVSYNGGAGGITSRATTQDSLAARDRHVVPVAAQVQHARTASTASQQRFSAPRGAAPGTVSAPSRAGARGNAAPSPGNIVQPRTTVHPNDLPSISYPNVPNTGNARTDQKYQSQQQQMITSQTRDRQRLQQQQDKEHQQQTRQPAAPAAASQLEQRHEQQTQQLQQKHAQQTQQMQQKQQPADPQRGRGGQRGNGRQ